MSARFRPRRPPLISAIAAAALLTLFTSPFDVPAQGAGPQSGIGAPSEPSYLEPLNADDSAPILGSEVVGPSGEDLGLITNVIVDRDGRPRAAVIDFGGFLGVGSRKIAVDWNLLQFEPGHDRKAVLALGRRAIQAAPEYRADATSAQMVGPPLVGPSSGPDGGR